ncbi:MAG: hypothetical protein IT336_00190 [Thermomicrobiales bacterium]|nr:hypothetical protein [Thermomicrobiales bacterium]
MSTQLEKPAAGAAPRFCSVVAHERGEDPIGTAWSAPRFIAMELPLPWLYNLLESRAVPAGLAQLIMESYEKALGWGFIAIAPDPDWTREGWTRLIDFTFPQPPFAAAGREEFLVETERITDFLRARMEGRDTDGMPGVERQSFVGRDLLVCTHGTVDACCARFGFPLYRQLNTAAKHSGEDVRVWRSTHFGGHRFAPTVLDFPEGRYWGFLRSTVLPGLIHHNGDSADLRDCYRGWAGYLEPEAQTLEREALIREGWRWTQWPQQLEILERDGDGLPLVMRITAFPPDGPAIAYEGRIETDREIETLFETDGEYGTRKLQRIVDLNRTPIPS